MTFITVFKINRKLYIASWSAPPSHPQPMKNSGCVCEYYINAGLRDLEQMTSYAAQCDQ